MNNPPYKNKKLSIAMTKNHLHPHLDKNPSATSIRHLQGHCMPKLPPNYQPQYAHPRKNQEHKENYRGRENHHHQTSVKEHKQKNVLLQQPRKSNVAEDGIKKTHKKTGTRTAHLRSQWVSPDQNDGLGCHQHLSSQIYRQSGHSSMSKTRKNFTGTRTLSIEQQIIQFEKDLETTRIKEIQQSLHQLVKQEQEYSRHTHHINYLYKQTDITWLRRAIILDWAMKIISEFNCRRQVFAGTVSLFDRFLAISPPIPINKLQLTATACLLIAEKLEDNSRIGTHSFYQCIQDGHTLEELLTQQTQIVNTLKFRLKVPTTNTWADQLCTQWDNWITNSGNEINVRFKAQDQDSYHHWRWITQYIDFALLDIQTLQYKNRTIAASFLYLTLIIKLELHTQEVVSTLFKRESGHILADTKFNKLFSNFLFASMGFPLEDILPTIQYCSSFTVLNLNFNQPILLRQEQMPYGEFFGIQTHNKNFKGCLNSLDRGFW